MRKVYHFAHNVPKVPLVILVIIVSSAVFANFLPLHDPEAGDLRYRLRPPCWQEGGITKYPLGTDTMGRDILSRLIYGARISLISAFVAVFLAAGIGVILGVSAGFLSGWAEVFIMGVTDAWLSIPSVIFALLLAVVIGPGKFNVAIIMGIIFWTRYARVVRGETLSLKTRDFVHLATVSGHGKLKIMKRHILPNVMNSVITLASLQIGVVIVIEASLTFLGVGVPPPTPAWGLMLSEGSGGLFTGYWWLIVWPGISICSLVISFNLLGDWVRLRIDPNFQNL